MGYKDTKSEMTLLIKDIDILEQLIKDTESHEVLADDDKVLVPIFRALIAEIDRKTKKYASWSRRNAPCQN